VHLRPQIRRRELPRNISFTGSMKVVGRTVYTFYITRKRRQNVELLLENQRQKVISRKVIIPSRGKF
jgi:hypothetical protein